MRKYLFLAIVLTCTSLQACRKDTDLIPEEIVQPEVIPEVETARLYKFKGSRVKKALKFSTNKKTKLC
jgi:hypothetical protein